MSDGEKMLDLCNSDRHLNYSLSHKTICSQVCVKMCCTRITILIKRPCNYYKVCEGQDMLLSLNKYWQKIQQKLIPVWCWHGRFKIK